jgi:hypothetical protein
MWPELFGRFWGLVILTVIALIYKIHLETSYVADRIKL